MPIWRAHLEGVPLDAALELLKAIMREPDRASRQEHRRERDIEREGRVIAAAETAADIGELRIDPLGLETPRSASPNKSAIASAASNGD